MPGFPRPGYLGTEYPYSKKKWNNSVLEPSNSCFIVNRYSLLGSSKNYSKYFWNIFACPESLPNFGICRYGSKIHHFFWNTVNFSTGTGQIPKFWTLSFYHRKSLASPGCSAKFSCRGGLRPKRSTKFISKLLLSTTVHVVRVCRTAVPGYLYVTGISRRIFTGCCVGLKGTAVPGYSVVVDLWYLEEISVSQSKGTRL